MRGVVIWYSPDDFQAVIWCEDSKDLGIASGAVAWRNPMATVEVGDFVGFRADSTAAGRRCRDVYMIDPVAAPSLPEAILQTRRNAPRFSGNPLLHLCASHD